MYIDLLLRPYLPLPAGPTLLVTRLQYLASAPFSSARNAEPVGT